MARYHCSIDFAQKLKVMEWLKKNEEEFSTLSYTKIAERGGPEIGIDLTNSVVRGIAQAMGLKHLRFNKEDTNKKNQDKVIVGALINLYFHGLAKAPKELLELAKTLGVLNNGQG